MTSPTPPPDTLACLFCADWEVTVLLPAPSAFGPVEVAARALIDSDVVPALRAHVCLEHPDRLPELDAQIAARGSA